MTRTTVTVALVVPVLVALLAGGALTSHMVIQCPDPGASPAASPPAGSPPSCEGTEADEDMKGTASDDKMAGGGGDDLMYGLAGKDTVSGGAGEDMIGGDFDGSGVHEQRLLFLTANGQDPDEDVFSGGPGKDVIFARECEIENERDRENCGDTAVSPTARAKDHIDCGPGNTDFASFDKKPGVAMDVVRNCERLEWKEETIGPNTPCAAEKPWDNANVKCIAGTNGPDKNLVDRDNPDARMVDSMVGFAGNDTLRARRGFDMLWGGIGNDTLYGGPGEDRLNGEEGTDTIDAGGGDDLIDAESATPGEPDTISCGGGDDDWVWINLGSAINKSTGELFTQANLTEGGKGPHDPATAPAGCEYVWNGGASLGNWLGKVGKPKKPKKHRR